MKTTGLDVCKYLVFIFNFIFFIGGGFLMGMGIYALVSQESFATYVPPDVPIKSAIGVLIFVGSVIFGAGFFGCCGAINENKCMLMTFFVVILLIFIVEIAGVILMYVYYPRVGREIVKFINKGSEEYQAVETELKCCGFNGPNDYSNSTMPASCYPNKDTSKTKYDKGCKDYLTKYFWYIGGMGIFILFIEIVAMISAIALFKGVDEYETA